METERGAWLERAMASHEEALFRLCFAYLGDAALAEDAVQESFVKAYKGYDHYGQDVHDKAWLTRIAINTCKDTMRFDSTKYLALIPASALVRDNMIWVAEPVRNGSKTSYVARSMTIKRATGNAAFIPSDDWLGDTLVITQWDKPLSEGETVLLPKDVL